MDWEKFGQGCQQLGLGEPTLRLVGCIERGSTATALVYRDALDELLARIEELSKRAEMCETWHIRYTAQKQRADELEKRCADLEILAEKWCEHECLASTCDDCPLEGRNV